MARILRHDRPSLDTGLQSLACGVRVTSLTPATGSSPAGRHGSGISPRTALILPCAGACERLVRQVKSKKFVSKKDLVLICQKGLSSYLYLVSPASGGRRVGEQKETNEQVTSCCDRAAPGEKILKSEWKFLISERLPEF